MARTAKEFEIVLTKQEASEMLEPAGDGGHQQLADDIRAQLQNGNLTVCLDDCEMGKLIRYMTQYGSGGFQGRLQHAFRRPLIDLISGR